MIEYVVMVLGIACCLSVLIWVKCCNYYQENHLRRARLMCRKASWLRRARENLEKEQNKYLEMEELRNE